ncbi:MAG: RidA family protein [Gemmatimonadetes bacterium]|nr:RidA family protein [Gemmatimonadota bacterium]
MTFEIVNPAALGTPRGWNNGMLAPEGGRVLFVAGQIGVAGAGAGGGREGADEEGAGLEGADQEGADREGTEPRDRGAAGSDLPRQFGAALGNVMRVVEAAGGRVADVGRLTIYVTDMDEYRESLREVGAEYRAVFGKHFPAMALVAVTELVDPHAVVEVEATAVIPARREGAT